MSSSALRASVALRHFSHRDAAASAAARRQLSRQLSRRPHSNMADLWGDDGEDESSDDGEAMRRESDIMRDRLQNVGFSSVGLCSVVRSVLVCSSAAR